MFIEKHPFSTNSDKNLAFIKSSNVQAFPCGRRRSEKVYKNGNAGESYNIPFDPEARLNTEANNRKHSSLNGFTQTYLKDWNETKGTLALVLEGYLFNIMLDSGYKTINDFGSKLSTFIGTTDPCIYANIRIEEISLFSDTDLGTYYTSVLRDQTDEITVNANIDCLKRDGNSGTSTDYYFAGLSFSTSPLANSSEETRKIEDIENSDVKQQVVSLRILDKINDGWQIHQPACLPKIEHGKTEDSVNVKKIYQDGVTVPSMTLSDNNDGTFQLHIFNI